MIALRRVPNRKAGRGQQPVEIFVGLVVRLVAPATADEIADIAEILADDEQLRAAVAEPLLPVADHIGIEVEFGAAPDLAGASLDTDAASLARRDELSNSVMCGQCPDSLGQTAKRTIREAELFQVLQRILEIIAARAAAAGGAEDHARRLVERQRCRRNPGSFGAR